MTSTPHYDIAAVHQRILRILTRVDQVCRAHGLDYYIWAGTMLGAVRHKGFIPWDDDIDIAMPRPAYEALVTHCREWLPAPLELVSARADAAYPLPFAKIQDASTTLIERLHLGYKGGLYIDVFPIDGVPDGRLRQRWHFARYEYYKRVLYLLVRDPYKRGHGPSSWVPLLCRRLYTLGEVQRKVQRLLTRYDYDSATLVADYDDGLRGIMPKATLGTALPIAFEGHEVMGVEHYDAYLANKYGDYMTIPPADKQRRHNFHYVDLDHPYKDGSTT